MRVIGFLDSSNSSSSYWLDENLQQASVFAVPPTYPKPGVSQSFFVSQTLPAQNHTLVIKHSQSGGGTLWVDEIEYMPIVRPNNDAAMGSGSQNQGQHGSPPDSPSSSSPTSLNSSSSPTPSPTSSSQAEGEHGGHHHQGHNPQDLSGGAIAAIVLACVAVVIAIVLLAAYLFRRSSTRKRGAAELDFDSTFVRIVSHYGMSQ